MALLSFAAKTFAAKTFAAGLFTGASAFGPGLGTFASDMWAANTFASATFSRRGLEPPSGRTGLQMFAQDTFASRTFAPATFGAGLGRSPKLPQVVQPPQCVPTYAPNLSFVGDELIWDNVETVSYVSVDKAGDDTFCPSFCHRSAITLKELAASNGVYVPRDVVLRIPKAQLPGTIPKPRDRWTDSEGVTFTVLENGRNVGRERYRLICRDLVIENALDDLIDIQRPTITYDSAGVKLKTPWTVVYGKLAARVQPIEGSIVDERGVRGLKVSHECILSQVVVVTNEDRVVLGTNTYEIRGFSMPERIDELMRLELDLVP